MNKPIILIFTLPFFMMFLTIISRQQHLLSSILCLEGMMLLMVPLLSTYSNYHSMNMSVFMIILLTISVSSASMSLTIMVMMSRKEGTDSMLSYSMSMC